MKDIEGLFHINLGITIFIGFAFFIMLFGTVNFNPKDLSQLRFLIEIFLFVFAGGVIWTIAKKPYTRWKEITFTLLVEFSYIDILYQLYKIELSAEGVIFLLIFIAVFILNSMILLRQLRPLINRI